VDAVLAGLKDLVSTVGHASAATAADAQLELAAAANAAVSLQAVAAGVVPATSASISTAEAPGGLSCPHCRKGPLHQSRTRTVPDRIRKRFTTDRPFRCADCGWRGWLPPTYAPDRATLKAPQAPDLTALDSAIKPPASSLRPSFSPRDLQ
jgi:hypothetical protein